MDYELLYIHLVKNIESNLKTLDNLIIDPKVTKDGADRYALVKVWLQDIRDYTAKDVLHQIIK